MSAALHPNCRGPVKLRGTVFSDFLRFLVHMIRRRKSFSEFWELEMSAIYLQPGELDTGMLPKSFFVWVFRTRELSDECFLDIMTHNPYAAAAGYFSQYKMMQKPRKP